MFRFLVPACKSNPNMSKFFGSHSPAKKIHNPSFPEWWFWRVPAVLGVLLFSNENIGTTTLYVPANPRPLYRFTCSVTVKKSEHCPEHTPIFGTNLTL